MELKDLILGTCMHTHEYNRMRAKRTNGVVNAGLQESWGAVVSVCLRLGCVSGEGEKWS
jgi:hypothetical protein